MSYKVTKLGEDLHIKLTDPYKLVLKILSYKDEINTETSESFFSKYFRISQTNIVFSDWTELTNENLRIIQIDSTKDFWIEYKYIVSAIAPNTALEFISVSLEIITTQGQFLNVTNNSLFQENNSNNLILNQCCNDNFKPYDLMSKNLQIYEQMSNLISNMFGHDVTYYHTTPNKKSKDVVLKEYSLYNVECVKTLKVLVPDNAFPTKELQFDQLGIDLPDLFEIHIVRKVFQELFGPEEIPHERDYLYFPFVKRMYEVNAFSFSEETPFYADSYFKVNLSLYHKRSNVDMTPEIEQSVDDLIQQSGKIFKEEIDDEIKKIRKPKVYDPPLTGEYDYIRRKIFKSLQIITENIDFNNLVISRYNYDLQTIDKDEVGVVFKYNESIGLTDNRNIQFWCNIKTDFSLSKENLISFIKDNFHKSPKTCIVTTINKHYFFPGNYIKIQGSQVYNGIHKVITHIDDFNFEIETNFIIKESNLINCQVRQMEEYSILNYDNKLVISMIKELFIIKINNDVYYYNINALLNINQWYAFSINMSNEFKQLSLFIYTFDSNTSGNALQNIYQKTNNLLNKVNLQVNDNLKLIASNIKFTNLRIFKECIEIEELSLVLSQYVVRDTQLALLVDNALPQLRFAKKYNR